MIAIFINRVLQNKPPLIYGNGEQTRDYTYISDVINAYDLILKTKGNPGKNGINFGSGSEVSVNKIAEVIIDKSEINNNQKLKPKYVESRPYNRFQIYLTKQFKFSVNTIFTLWMTGLPRSGKTTIAKNLGKENIKNVVSIGDSSVDILAIAKKRL